MISRLLTVYFSLFLVSCSDKQPNARIIDYGVYDAVILTSGKWQLGIPVTIASVAGLEHQQTVSQVPAEDGRYWGFRARLTNPQSNQPVKVEYTISHPEFTTPDGTKSSIVEHEFELPPGDSITEDFLWFFIKGCEHEFVPGTWTLQILLDGRAVITKAFQIYKP